MSSELVKALKAWDTYEPNISEEKVLMQAIAVIDAARPLLARLEALEAENARLREALDEIISPFAVMKQRAEAQGARLSGMAYEIANSVAHLKMIARRAREGCNADG